MSRIGLLKEPYPEWFAAAMARIMPQGAPPLKLFRAIGTSRRAWDKFAAGSLLDKGPLPLREREIVILRTCARCGCGYEWGVHAALFAARAGLTEAQLADTAAAPGNPTLWSNADAALLDGVDALIDRKRLAEPEFAQLSSHFGPDQILEIIQLVAFYTGVSMICGALAIEPEPGTPALPSAA
ncbi:MAG TPA: carboxymuconolactone decarboxylase family protein [Allosphingosinicella sp.]